MFVVRYIIVKQVEACQLSDCQAFFYANRCVVRLSDDMRIHTPVWSVNAPTACLTGVTQRER